MKFLLDSCISKFAVETLREKGFEVLWIPEIGEDPGDETIIKRAFEENFVLVTLDKDFGELIFVFNKPHSAIIRLVDIPPQQQGEILLKVIDTYKKDIENKALITIDKYRVRVRFKKREIK